MLSVPPWPLPCLPGRAALFAASIGATFPWLEETGVIDVLIPKKEPVVLGKM